MSASKLPQLKEKQRQNTKKLCLQNVDQLRSKHEDERIVAGRSALKRSLGSKEKHVKNAPKAKKKNFVIPRKNNQAKELLQSQHFDSREVKDLLRHVKLSFRHQSSSSTFKFEKAEFVNNEKLSQKYAEKKQELRLELPKNRELEEKFAFLYTQSRTKAKTICEHGLQTGHCQLNFLGDPKLGIYLCRYADIVYKRTLDVQDAGYLIVFNMIKGRVKGISGGNPEQQPTPHHDCHVSKLFTNLSSTASHTEVYGASQLYFYEIDENSEDFHAKKPRQVLPYAVLTFSIKPQDPQTMPLNEKPEEKNPVQRHAMPSRTDENTVSSPVPEDDFIENIPSAFNVSWTGQLLFKNKFIAFINLLSYSKKKLLLPDYVEQRLNICKKISQENLKTLYKNPIFRNGKPASTGVSKEFCSSGKFIYYEIQPVTQQREKYDKLLTYFVKDNTAAVLEYYGGSVHMYIMPTSQLTHDAGITDEKSPMILHALVHIKRLHHFPLNQEIQQLTSTDDTSSSEDNIRKQFQTIFGEKYKSKSQKRHSKIPSLLYKEILLNSGRDSDQISSSSVEDPKSRKRESPRTKHDDKSSSHKSLHRSESWSGHDEHDSRHTTRDSSSSSYSSSSRYKWHKLQKRPSADNTSSKNTSNQEQLNTITEDQFPRDHTSKAELEQQQSDKDSTTETTVNLREVQRLIEQFKRQGTSLSAGLSTTRTTRTTTVDPRLHSRQPSNTDERRSERSVISRDSSIPPPPIPPPPPPPLSPLVAVLSPPLHSTPGESLELSSTPEATPPPTVSTLSTFNIPVVPQSISESPSCLMSPPAIKRKGINIPGLEAPGSAVFDLIKDTKMSSIRKTNRGNVDDSSSISHHLSPLVRPIDNSKTVTSSQQVNPVAVKEKTTSSLSQNSSSGISDKSPQSLGSRSIQVKPRPLTQAEKTASKAIKEVMNILERNAHVQDDSDSVPQDIHSLGNEINTTEDFRVKLKSILKMSSKDTVENSVSMNNPTVDNVGVVDTMLSHIPAIKELHKDKEAPAVKVVSLDEYRKQKLQPSSSTSDKTSCLNSPEHRPIQNCQSPATPELKSGLDLIDNLISKDKHRSQSVVKTASLRSSSIQSPSKDQDKGLVKKKTTYGKDDQSKKERNSLPKKRLRIVTIKSKAPEQRSSEWDNMTSDISDDDLPDDKITSDISDTELPDDYMEADDGRTESRNNSRSSSKSREVIPSSHHKPQYRHEEHERRFHEVCISQAWCDVEASESSRCYKKAFSSSRSSSPDERDRDRKRRRMDLNLNTYQKDEPLLCDNNSNDSGSAMSISPINSPVSFEYAATEGTYRSVIASPTGRGNLEVTIPQDGCTIIGGISLPRTIPTEVHMDSPGTPETAVPAEDFLHANIGYWSSEFTTNRLTTQTTEGVPAYGELGYLETHDNRRYETANQASDIQRSYHQDNVSEEGWSTPPSRPYSPYSPTKLVDDDIDEYPVRTTEEDHIVRGEGYQLRRCRSIGESSGYESPSYLDLRRPFFGTTEDVIPSMYDKNITCTEDDYDDKYMDRYTLPDDVPGREQQYYMSQSPYEHIDSPRSVDSIDDYNHDRLLTEGRDSPVTPEYMDCKYSLDRKLDDNYDDYYYRSPSDDGDAFEQRISTYDGDLDPYHDEADYFSDEEPRESHYFDQDEDRYYSPGDQDPQGSYISKPMAEYERDYPSDDESLNTSDYYDHDSYQYLDDMAKDNISTTMFELDRVVFDGITGFPTQVLNLSNYYNANQAMVDNPVDPVESLNSKSINQVSKNRDPRLNTRDPRLNKNDVTSSVNVANTEGTNQDGVPQTMDNVEKNVEKKAVKPHPRVQSYFYVYNPDNDNECESVKNYMLKTGALYLDVRDETKLKTIKGAVIRVLIRGKHKSALHKISNLSKLKCLRNVKFALFNTVEDVDKKTRAYTAIFQYGGVLIPDDFILKRVHPAYLEALLRFMREENVLHQKVFWVMNIRYQAYKKLVGSQRPLTWRDTFVLDLLRKYRNNGFVNIIHKEYVTEGLSLIQRYLDTAWKQQRDLLTTYRHFIMLSNMDKQRLEADWFRNRGMGFMDIKTFLLAFTGERKTRQLLSASIFTEDGDTRRPNTMDSSSRTVSTKNNRRDFKTSSSTMVSRSINYKADNNMKETRLEILSSINSVKDSLLNSMGGTATKDINDKNIAPLYSSKEGDIGRKDILDTRKEGNSSKERTTQFKGHVSSPQKGSTWSRTVRSVNSKDHALQRGDSPRRRRDSPYQSRTATNVDHADRKYVKDRLSSSHPRLSTT